MTVYVVFTHMDTVFLRDATLHCGNILTALHSNNTEFIVPHDKMQYSLYTLLVPCQELHMYLMHRSPRNVSRFAFALWDIVCTTLLKIYIK